jgi:HAD superfamily hydrolase (TIGR01450 family)
VQALPLDARGAATFVATNPDPSNLVGGRLMPENGAAVAAIETASGGRRALVAGKPSPALARALVAEFGLDPARTIMVGDRLDTDVAFANAAGLSSCLVLSGVASAADAAAAAEDQRPRYVMGSLADLIPPPSA